MFKKFISRFRIKGATDGTLIGNVTDRLKVDTGLTGPSGSLTLATSKKLRYVDMNATTGGVARGTILTTTETTLFEYIGTGLVFAFLVNLEEKKDWIIRFKIDGEAIFTSSGLLVSDLESNRAYDLDHNHDEEAELVGIRLGKHTKFIWSGPLEFPIRYDQSVKITIQRVSGKPNKKFTGGFIILTQET